MIDMFTSCLAKRCGRPLVWQGSVEEGAQDGSRHLLREKHARTEGKGKRSGKMVCFFGSFQRIVTLLHF